MLCRDTDSMLYIYLPLQFMFACVIVFISFPFQVLIFGVECYIVVLLTNVDLQWNLSWSMDTSEIGMPLYSGQKFLTQLHKLHTNVPLK